MHKLSNVFTIPALQPRCRSLRFGPHFFQGTLGALSNLQQHRIHLPPFLLPDCHRAPWVLSVLGGKMVFQSSRLTDDPANPSVGASMDGEQSTAPAKADFSFVLGGPLYQLYPRAGLAKPPIELRHRAQPLSP